MDYKSRSGSPDARKNFRPLLDIVTSQAQAVSMRGGRGPADITPFLKGRAFDSEITRIMGQAFDKATRALHDTGQPALVREVIAKRIIEIAESGVRDPDQLAKRALQALGISDAT